MIWYIADTHFGHANIIKHCQRPFASVDEMDQSMISRWNSCVDELDTIYVLGDFAFRNADEILKHLKGIKHLVRGSHDKFRKHVLDNFASISDLKIVEDSGQRVVLSHYPMLSWERSHYDTWHFHGHSHGNAPKAVRRVDVGVDCWGYSPVNFQMIRDRTYVNMPRCSGCEEPMEFLNQERGYFVCSKSSCMRVMSWIENTKRWYRVTSVEQFFEGK